MPALFYELMSLFPQPVKREPSVEFLPIPRKGSGAGKTQK
jgi:hypothetical protein